MVVRPRSSNKRSPTADKWRLLSWSLMAAAVFWTLVYRLGSEGAKLPEFAYVNF